MFSSSYTTPLISVIIPTYNMDNYLGEAIQSVVQGDFERVEVLVVDDGSTDDTRSIVGSFIEPTGAHFDSRVKYTKGPNEGKPSAVNGAIRRARGEYLTILDADDRLPSDSLSTRWAVAHASTGEKAEVVVGGFTVFDKAKTYGHRDAPQTEDPQALRRRFFLSYKTPFSLNTCLMSQKAVSETGFFDHGLRRCEDIDYALRLLRKVDRVAVVNKPVYCYRKHRKSVPERLYFRGQTIYYRPLALWQNASSPFKVLAACYGASVDLIKGAYEIYGSYKR